MKASDIAKKASELVAGDRQKTHGDKTRNFLNIARLWNAYMLSRPNPWAELTPTDIGHLMVLLKVARTQLGAFNLDDYVDMAGYAACAGEIAWLEASDETTETTS